MLEFKDPSDSRDKERNRMSGNPSTSAADMHDDESADTRNGRNRNNNNNGRNNNNTDDERETRERKASQEMYARINNPNKFNSNDNVIRIRKESVDLKEVDF